MYGHALLLRVTYCCKYDVFDMFGLGTTSATGSVFLEMNLFNLSLG